jgi:Ser/Thr protein kinase RdoA (MazF antagonist)
MPLSSYLHQYHNIQAQTIECLKDLDTLVFKVTDVLDNIYIIKLYNKNKFNLVNKLHEIALFLAYIQHPKSETPNPKPAILDFQLETYYVIVSKWIEGGTPKAITVAIARKMGATLAILHNAAEDFEPILSLQHINNTLMVEIETLILQSSLGIALDKNEKERLKEIFLKVQQKLNEIGYEKKHYGLIHSDLHFGNWLQQGNNVIPIDFDEMAYGHYLTDIAVIFAEIDHFSSKQAAMLKKALLKGYGIHRTLPTTFSIDFLHFEYVAAALYLNWACHPNHSTILAHPQKRRFAEIALKKLIN